jgi:nitrogenase molybdenum-iron protein beta chain
MLLRHTPKEVQERGALTINPAKTCQPVGAMYAALGIKNCMPHSHGSQGCCAYHRSALTRHFKEPVIASTSCFTEGASVFGGQANLLQSIETIFSVYDPEIIAVHTTCLSETIGDDIVQISAKAREEGKVPRGKHIIYASTPSYAGSHVTGFASMVRSMAEQLAEGKGPKNETINIIPGFVEPSDVAEIKRIAEVMGIRTIVFPDTSNVFNGPLTGKYRMYPRGGTPVKDLKASGDSKATLALGPLASSGGARALDAKFKTPCEILELPIGLRATDRFVDTLRKRAGVVVPETVNLERGRLLDVISDMHQYFHGKTVALAGDPDQLVPLVEFLCDLDMAPRHIVSGTPGKKFERKIRDLTKDLSPAVNFKNGPGADLFLLHQWIKSEPVDLLIGNTYMKYIARDEGIPLVRMGFPIYDRTGHQYFPSVGYTGGLRVLEKILSALMDEQDRKAPEESFELVM